MKILLDENLPLDLRHFLAEHQVFTVAYMGWKGVSNGALLACAGDAKFDLLITRDSGIEYQQNLTNLPIAVIVVPRQAMKLKELLPLIPRLLDAINSMAPNTLVRL
jgi:predicted nuclease of predicted toxin-antitoxin system